MWNSLSVAAVLVAGRVAAEETNVVGEVAWFDPSNALTFAATTDPSECVCTGTALGEWASRLGAPAAAGGHQFLPVADILDPLEAATVVVVPTTTSLEAVAWFDGVLLNGEEEEEEDSVADYIVVDTVENTPPPRTAIAASAARDVLDGFFSRAGFLSSESGDDAPSFTTRRRLVENVVLEAVSDADARAARDRLVVAADERNGAVFSDAALRLASFAPSRALVVGEVARLVETIATPKEEEEEDVTARGTARVLYAPRLASADARLRRLAVRALLDAAAAASDSDSARHVVAVAALVDDDDANADLGDVDVWDARRLGGDNVTNVSGNETYYDLDEVRQFQLNMWTGIALILVLAAAIFAMANMNPEYDSILFATFQANVSAPMSKLE